MYLDNKTQQELKNSQNNERRAQEKHDMEMKILDLQLLKLAREMGQPDPIRYVQHTTTPAQQSHIPTPNVSRDEENASN